MFYVHSVGGVPPYILLHFTELLAELHVTNANITLSALAYLHSAAAVCIAALLLQADPEDTPILISVPRATSSP